MKAIASALAKAQAEMGNAIKDSNNPHFKSKYADLASVREACLPPLNRHGIAVLQPFVQDELTNAVKTMFIHGESGESLECSIPLLLARQDMQGLGAAITYARRYGLMMMSGIAPDEEQDDDGNSIQANPIGAALGDAWEQSVRDNLPQGASPRQTAEAFAEALSDSFKSKTGLKALQNEWNRRIKYIRTLEHRFADLHADVVDAYENQVLALEKPSGLEAVE